MDPHCPLGPLPSQAVLRNRSFGDSVLGRWPALRASAQSTTSSFSFKNENATSKPSHSLSEGSVLLPKTDRTLRRAGEVPLPRRPSVCLGPRFWAVLWHPFTTGPTVSTTCTSYSLIFGVSHTQGERQPRAHPALPESTPNPLYLPHTPSLNLSRPDTRQQRTVPKPAGIIGRGRSQAVRPALPCPCHTDPQPQASPACPPALVEGMEVRCNSGVLTSPQSQDQAPEPLPPALKSSLCPP